MSKTKTGEALEKVLVVPEPLSRWRRVKRHDLLGCFSDNSASEGDGQLRDETGSHSVIQAGLTWKLLCSPAWCQTLNCFLPLQSICWDDGHAPSPLATGMMDMHHNP